MTTEEWMPIPFAPDYQVSDLGRVRSHRRSSSRILALGVNPVTGYVQVKYMRADGQRATSNVQKLVLAAFVGPRPEGYQTRHLDGDKLNNRLENLRYGTARENILDQVRHGTHPWASRTHCSHGHEYTPENTRITVRASRTGVGDRAGRICRACVREQQSARAG